MSGDSSWSRHEPMSAVPPPPSRPDRVRARTDEEQWRLEALRVASRVCQGTGNATLTTTVADQLLAWLRGRP